MGRRGDADADTEEVRKGRECSVRIRGVGREEREHSVVGFESKHSTEK
jgi:hypothetical protein